MGEGARARSGGHLTDAVRERYAHDPDPLVRTQALATIADDHVDANLPLIRAGLDDADVIVRGYAIGRYSKSHDANKLATLQAAEQRARSDKQNDARLAAIGSIAEIDYPERENVLRALLTDRDPVVRRSVGCHRAASRSRGAVHAAAATDGLC
jgi:HEAT repeat protein